jgi:ParB-like chromosome segregation protein Spo0J
MTKAKNTSCRPPDRPAGPQPRRRIHPIADLFPMMTDEELADLAADIKANSLLHPIVVDKDGLLIDGRNRDRACEIAGIEPATVLFEGDDPRAYIIASNISRRHLTKGQQAMAMAMIYPAPEKGGRGKKKTMDETSTLFSPKRLQLARTVLAYSSDLAQAVLAGSKFLDAAYDEAKKAKQLLDAQVAGNARRKVARSKKVVVLRGIVGTSHEIDALAKPPAVEQHSLAEAAKQDEKVSAITAHSACDPEAPEMSAGTEEIELPMQDFDRLAKFKRRTVDREVLWVAEQLELAWCALRDRARSFRPRT